MNIDMSWLVFVAGILQLSVLVASSLVPFQLDWRKELASLPKLHRQMYFVYGGYVVLGILWLGAISIIYANELTAAKGAARWICVYAALFWGIRVSLQAVFDAKPFLKKWWVRAGYHLLTVLFCYFTLVFGYLAIRGPSL
jgi:hypothetical protein